MQGVRGVQKDISWPLRSLTPCTHIPHKLAGKISRRALQLVNWTRGIQAQMRSFQNMSLFCTCSHRRGDPRCSAPSRMPVVCNSAPPPELSSSRVFDAIPTAPSSNCSALPVYSPYISGQDRDPSRLCPNVFWGLSCCCCCRRNSYT